MNFRIPEFLKLRDHPQDSVEEVDLMRRQFQLRKKLQDIAKRREGLEKGDEVAYLEDEFQKVTLTNELELVEQDLAKFKAKKEMAQDN